MSETKTILNVRREELPLALLMFAYFFLVITSFWILKPLKKTLFIAHYDESGFALGSLMLTASQAELLAKVLNMGVAFVAVIAFSALASRLRRQQLTYVFSVFFVASYAAYATAIGDPGSTTVWTFYLFGDLFSSVMVAAFFAFLNDSVTPDRAKRLYGLVGLGGVTGGVFGASTVRALIDTVTPAGWMLVCAVLGGAIIVVAWAAGRIVAADPPPSAPAPVEPEEPVAGNPALDGARLVLRSPYLAAVVATVGLYEMVSTILDYQFTSTIAYYVDGPDMGRHFATVFAITNGVSLVVQLLLTSFVMTRLGVGVALLVTPAVILLGSVGFLVAPVLWMGSFLNTADNGFSYSINQSAKEALYVPTTRDEKYKAKAFIDVFVQRFAKALAVGLSLALTVAADEFSEIRLLSFVVVVILVMWIFAARYAGRRFAELTEPAGD